MATTFHSNLYSLFNKHEKKHLKTFSYIPQKNASLPTIKAIRGKDLIESGIVQSISSNEAGLSLKSGDGGLRLLDVRPEWEYKKACVSESLHIPMFIEDIDNSPITLLKKWVHFGYIGLWTGQHFTTLNADFVTQVLRVVPNKDDLLLVACGEGLRSMIAVSKLHEAGYKKIGWLSGGFNRSKDGDFSVEGDEKLQYATIGGASFYFLQLLNLLQGETDSK